MWEKYRWFYLSFHQIQYFSKQGCIFLWQKGCSSYFKITHMFKMTGFSHLKIVNSSSKINGTIPASNCGNQKSSQDCSFQTGSFLNWKECTLRESWDVIFHQQLNGVAFPAYVSKQNSDMNSKIPPGSPQTYALPRLVAKQREVKRLRSCQSVGSIVPSTINSQQFWCSFLVRPNRKVLEFQLMVIQDGVFLSVISESWHIMFMSKKLFLLEYLKMKIFSISKRTSLQLWYALLSSYR